MDNYSFNLYACHTKNFNFPKYISPLVKICLFNVLLFLSGEFQLIIYHTNIYY